MHTFDSSGPNVKIRGTAAQILDKYLALARDALASGDRITAENYYQHAEHYFRVLNANGSGSERSPERPGGNGAGDPRTAGRRGDGQSQPTVADPDASAEPGDGDETNEPPDGGPLPA